MFERSSRSSRRRSHARRVVERERRATPRRPPVADRSSRRRCGSGPMLWTRRPEHWNFLALRLGIGRARSRNTIQRSERPTRHRPSTSTASTGCATRYRHDRRRSGRRVAAERRARSASPGRAHLAADAAARPRRAAVRAALAERARRRRAHRPRLGEGARVAEVAAAHHERAQPVRATCRSRTASPTGAALLTGLEEASSMRRSRHAESTRLPLDEDWDPMRSAPTASRRRTRRRRRLEGDRRARDHRVDDAPVDRARLTQVLERGADVGIYRSVRRARRSRRCPPRAAPSSTSPTASSAATRRLRAQRRGATPRRRVEGVSNELRRCSRSGSRRSSTRARSSRTRPTSRRSVSLLASSAPRSPREPRPRDRAVAGEQLDPRPLGAARCRG